MKKQGTFPKREYDYESVKIGDVVYISKHFRTINESLSGADENGIIDGYREDLGPMYRLVKFSNGEVFTVNMFDITELPGSPEPRHLGLQP